MRYVGIDPSLKTGIVLMNIDGTAWGAKEITTKEKSDPHRFLDIANSVIELLEKDDIVCIEGFSYGSKGAAVSIQYGIGWSIRSALVQKGMTYIEVPPTTVKKFATGKGNAKKEDMVLPIYKRWGFEHKSDNVRDAFVLAKIAEALTKDLDLTAYQKEALKKVVG